MKTYSRVLVIGDVHGEFTKLMSLYKKIAVTDNDFVIFLGDYVDRGRENVKVLKFMMKEVKKENVIALCGNHEDMLATDIATCYVSLDAHNKTLREIALQNQIEKNFDEKVLKFIKSLPFTFEMEINGKEYFFCHAGIDPNVPFDEQDETDLIWIREEFFTAYDGEKIVVVGHTPVMFLPTDEEIKTMSEKGEDFLDDEQKASSCYVTSEKALQVSNCKPQWRRGGKILMMDTGSFMPNGFISCIDLLSGDIWQSD